MTSGWQEFDQSMQDADALEDGLSDRLIEEIARVAYIHNELQAMPEPASTFLRRCWLIDLNEMAVEIASASDAVREMSAKKMEKALARLQSFKAENYAFEPSPEWPGLKRKDT